MRGAVLLLALGLAACSTPERPAADPAPALAFTQAAPPSAPLSVAPGSRRHRPVAQASLD